MIPVAPQALLSRIVLALALTSTTCSSAVRFANDGGDAESDSSTDGRIDGDENDAGDAEADEASGCESSNPCFSWALSLGGPSTDIADDIVADHAGNVYVTGSFDFSYGPSSNDTEGFVASYSAEGNERWMRRVGIESSDVRLVGITLDEADNVYVTGTYLMISYTSEGLLRWESPIVLDEGNGLSISLGHGGALYLGGYFSATNDLGGGAVTAVEDDLFLASYTVDGRYLSSWVPVEDGQQYVEGVAAGDEMSIYVAGSFWYGADPGGGSCPYAGQSDIFVASYWSDDLSYRWDHCFGGSGEEYIRDIIVDVRGDVYVTGAFSDTVDFRGELLVSEGGSDVFVARFSPDGELLWARGFGGIHSDRGRGVAIDDEGRVLVTGAFSDTINFDGNELISEGEPDIFIAALSPEGDALSAEGFGGPEFDRGEAIVSDECGNIWVSGFFSDAVYFNGSLLESAGSQDAFLLRLCEL